MSRLDWATIIDEGVGIVESYSTPVTLRQLHYRLVSVNVGGYTNTLQDYKQLSSRTAELRRRGMFPTLADNGRAVAQPGWFNDPPTALRALANQYTLDRTEGQHVQVWVLFEKATLAAQLTAWTSPYGLPTAALRGYSSETLEREVCDRIIQDGRPAVCFYIGDLDPEGVDIERNFQEQANRAGVHFKHWERLTVTISQVDEFGLVPNPGKESSSRAAGFVERFGYLFQIETEAVDPAVLQRLVVDAITSPEYFDRDTYDEVLEREDDERDRLSDFADTWDDGDAA